MSFGGLMIVPKSSLTRDLRCDNNLQLDYFLVLYLKEHPNSSILLQLLGTIERLRDLPLL